MALTLEQKRRYWTTKPADIPVYTSVVFDHPAFTSPIRLVANQPEAITLGGQVFTPCRMDVNPPDQSRELNASFSVSFSRITAGSVFKSALDQIGDSFAPITATYQQWIASDLTEADKTYQLYVKSSGGINFGKESITVNAGYENPNTFGNWSRYTPDVFTGLRAI